MELLVAVVVIGLLFVVTKNRKDQDLKNDKALDEILKETDDLQKKDKKGKPSPAKIKRRYLSSRRSRPVTNRRYRSKYGYDEGSDIEDVLLYLWLLDDFDWNDYSDDNEWNVDGIDGVSWVSFDGETVTYYNDDDQSVFEVKQTSTGLTANDLLETTLVYFVDSASEMITVYREGEKETLSYIDDEWINPIVQPETDLDDSSLYVEDLVEEITDTAEDVAFVAAADLIETNSDVNISVGSDNDSSSDSSVDSDTAY